MTFAEISTRIYCYLVYAMMPIGALIILGFMLNLCMKLWRKWQDRAIENYRFQQRFKQMRESLPEVIKVTQEENNERK